jgi:selenocysteine-specific elongation factor
MGTENAAASSAPEKRARNFVLGTAGHIDHGKTSLIKALTGTDTDRLPEEQRRGMTIELGFAQLVLGDVCFGIVDVPGHERFVRTMVAGATGIDMALIVVAADDSVMPQTVEHVDVLHLLGITNAVVAVTKIDTVDEDMVELVVEEVRELLAGTPLADSAVCPVSSVTGAGLDGVRAALEAASAKLSPSPTAPPFRMCVDRVFTVAGRGTVVTGSVTRGQVASGDTLETWPGLKTCRVRDLQAHGIERERLGSGQRAALNLSGVDREQLRRGAELATPGYLKPAKMLDVELTCLTSHGKPLKSTSKVRLELGTVEHPVRVVLLGQNVLEPGASAFAQLRCGEPVVATYGQRFIIRDETAVRTIGGGVVLRPLSRRRRGDPTQELDALERLKTGEEADRVEDVLYRAGFGSVTDLDMCARAGVELDALPDILDALRAAKRWIPIPETEMYVVPAVIDDLTERLVGWLERFHRKNPEQPGRPAATVLSYVERMAGKTPARSLFDGLIQRKKIKRFGRFICLPAFAPELSSADERILASMIREIGEGGFQPPTPEATRAASQVDRKRIERLATLAVAMGELIKIDTRLYLHKDTEARLRETLADLIGKSGGATVSEARAALDSSRKFVVPIMEYLDRVGFTRRVGDKRVLAGENE